MDYDPNCIFCKIANRKIGKLESETNSVAVFMDIQPKAKVHLLIAPKRHISSLNEVGENDQKILSELLPVAKLMAEKFGLKNGHRIVINTGPDGGQSVSHLHLHLLGGEQLKGDL